MSDFRVNKTAAAFIAAISAIVVFLSAVYFFISKLENGKVVSPSDYYEIGGDAVPILHGGEITDYRVARVGDKFFVPVNFVKDYFDKYIFYEPAAERVIYTNGGEIERVAPQVFDGEAYIDAELLNKWYFAQYVYSPKFNLLYFDFYDSEYAKISDKGKIALRYEPNIKSPVIEYLADGDLVALFSDKQIGSEWTAARSASGVVGYAKIKGLLPVKTDRAAKPERLAQLSLDGKITAVWDQIFSFEGNSAENKKNTRDDLDLLIPTWFSFDASTGAVRSIGDKQYVDWARSNGYMVWGLVTDNFDEDVSHLVLTDASVRDEAVRRLAELCEELGLDGINVDFEMVKKADAEYYAQFLRELAAELRPRGKFTSAAMYVPAAHNLYYNRAAVGESADYIMIMAYDEYWSTAPTSGPNASITFVENAIVNTLKEAPKERVLLGLPFYVRIWTETANGPKSEAFSMRGAYEKAIGEGGDFVWSDEYGCFYAEYEVDGGTRKIWLEDERSIEEKMKLYEKYDLAGVACWKRNLETDAAWEAVIKGAKN